MNVVIPEFMFRSRRTNRKTFAMKHLSLLTVSLLAVSGCILDRGAYQSMSNRTVRSTSEGMLPAIGIGDSIIIDEHSYQQNKINRFDLVVVKSPRMEADGAPPDELLVVKRVVGLPGENIEIGAGKVFIDGQELNEPFPILNDESEAYQSFDIRDNEYFLLGDNRPKNEDGRHWKRHSVARSSIIAKVIQIIPSKTTAPNPVNSK